MRPEPQRNVFVTICRSHVEAEAAIRNLHLRRFDMKSVSVAALQGHSEREVAGCYWGGKTFRYRGYLGAFWEGLWEMLDGFGFFWMPGLGWVLIAGPFAGWVVATLDNSSIFSGLSAVGSAIYSIGMPWDDVVKYEAGIKAGGLLLTVHGSETVVETARQLFDHPTTE